MTLSLLIVVVATHTAFPVMSQRLYAVARGRQVGIFRDWATCSMSVQNFPKAIYKSFTDYSQATLYLNDNGVRDAAEPVVREIERMDAIEMEVTNLKRPREDSTDPAPPPPPKRHATDEIIVYTDGSCLGNGQAHDSVIAGAGAWFGKNDPRNVSCSVPGKQTNNRGEIYAVVKALEQCPARSRVAIHTDSWTTIQGVKNTKSKRKANGDLLELIDRAAAKMTEVRYVKVKAHSGILGNEMADALAKQACYRALRMARKITEPSAGNEP